MFLFLILFLIAPCSGQERVFRQYEKTKLVPKISVIKGEQWMGEIGLYRINYAFLAMRPDDSSVQNGIRFHLRNSFFASSMHGIYIATEIFSFEDDIFWGPKIGYELTALAPTFASAIGIDVKYYTDGKDRDAFAFAPKIGIPFGFFNFFYSYNLYTNNKFDRISGAHQFQLSFNMDFKTMRIKKKMLRDWRREYQKPKDMLITQTAMTTECR